MFIKTMLRPIEIPRNVDSRPIPPAIESAIASVLVRIERFQDRWDRPQIEQFVAADYRHVYQAIDWVVETQMPIGRRFIEWGCGFSVVAAMAATLGLDVIGVEAEMELMAQGQRTITDWNVDVELVHGNFLPPGSERLADDPMLPSLNHPVASAYRAIGLDLDDFAIVYSYPWPGEDDFHRQVFRRHAAVGAILITFCGPNDIQVWRKTNP